MGLVYRVECIDRRARLQQCPRNLNVTESGSYVQTRPVLLRVHGMSTIETLCQQNIVR